MTYLFAFCLPALPLLILLAFLLLGRYPGCEAIVRLSERLAARPRRRAAAAAGRPLRAPTRAVSGGLLLVRGLRGRAPPALASI